MTNREKQILKEQLDEIYHLFKQVENSTVQDTTEFRIMFELEEINRKLNIPFND